VHPLGGASVVVALCDSRRADEVSATGDNVPLPDIRYMPRDKTGGIPKKYSEHHAARPAAAVLGRRPVGVHDRWAQAAMAAAARSAFSE
jgi:hypothetical protein